MKKPGEGIGAQVDSAAKAMVKKNQDIIQSLAKAVHFCGTQGIALRGHRDDGTADSAVNRGNFQELVAFRVDSGDRVLKDDLNSCRANMHSTPAKLYRMN